MEILGLPDRWRAFLKDRTITGEAAGAQISRDFGKFCQSDVTHFSRGWGTQSFNTKAVELPKKS
jgi:hypothetical protein